MEAIKLDDSGLSDVARHPPASGSLLSLGMSSKTFTAGSTSMAEQLRQNSASESLDGLEARCLDDSHAQSEQEERHPPSRKVSKEYKS